MINQEFDHIISLGSFCQTAYQIRRYFGCEKAHTFDWWVTPTVGLVELIESQFIDLFVESNMTIVEEEAGAAVMCARYGLMHYHDFDNSKIAGRPAPFLVRAECKNNISKFSYLVKRLLSINGKVLFIRMGTGYVQHYEKNMDFNEDLLKRFIIAMERMLPNIEFQILLLNSTPIEIDKRVTFDTVNNYDVTLWNGSDQGWGEMFSRQQIRLGNLQII